MRWQYQSRFEPLQPVIVSETVTLDKWYSQNQQPLFIKRGFVSPSFFWNTETPAITETVTLDKWYRENEHFVFDRQRNQFGYPTIFWNTETPSISAAPSDEEDWRLKRYQRLLKEKILKDDEEILLLMGQAFINIRRRH